MLQLSKEKKSEYAAMLRMPSNLPDEFPADYFDIIYDVNVSELYIESYDGFPVEVYRYDSKDREENCILYINIHGGGFVQPHTKNDSAFSAYLAKRLKCTVLDVDYRLAPEYPYPTGLNDAYAVYEWARIHAEELGCDPEKIVVGGNSSGGQFAAGVTMKAIEQGEIIPAACAMLYPVCSLEDVSDVDENADLEELGNRGKLYNLLYCTKDSDFDDPYVSLLKAGPDKLEKFPPLIMITGGKDILAPGGQEFAEHVNASSGSKVVSRCFQNSKHGFMVRCLGNEWKDAREMLYSELEKLLVR
ncbi:Acetyl esterase/lipase [Oribacterium sp. KHPX15]|uniref:alpha/beta hydrolase n=1 Tax=Oribacterium sp. KHPX15 TaxID=1855342 RepID=UPI0008988875|nr:alpha/beta hydrolase [Oribacterium sp. KHPX15]SEA93950.1 Acetyl esterase/lipase [Oribacterium sp. KHPX15]